MREESEGEEEEARYSVGLNFLLVGMVCETESMYCNCNSWTRTELVNTQMNCSKMNYKTPNPDTSREAKYGSKIKTILEKLREIRIEDPSAKVIMFTQWYIGFMLQDDDFTDHSILIE